MNNREPVEKVKKKKKKIANEKQKKEKRRELTKIYNVSQTRNLACVRRRSSGGGGDGSTNFQGKRIKKTN